MSVIWVPIIRKIIEVGKTSRAIIIPKSWLEYYEKVEGRKIEEVAIEVDRVLIIHPVTREAKNQPPAKV